MNDLSQGVTFWETVNRCLMGKQDEKNWTVTVRVHYGGNAKPLVRPYIVKAENRNQAEAAAHDRAIADNPEAIKIHILQSDPYPLP